MALHFFRSFHKATQLTKQGIFLLKTKWQAKVPSGEHWNIISNLESIIYLIIVIYTYVIKCNAASYDVLSCGNVPKLWLILRVAPSCKALQKVPPQPEQGSGCFKGHH